MLYGRYAIVGRAYLEQKTGRGLQQQRVICARKRRIEVQVKRSALAKRGSADLPLRLEACSEYAYPDRTINIFLKF